ncbi:MAG: hypothetical protein CMC89_03075 [Flavobacteriaceae bacterium]|nr:hypothetical protein [Flavobacteriaceae bacterium]|tara:strand:- start:3229 stop:3600 length:372 start_codon:yes stop_codon:yes gene_type:complete
MASLNLPTKPDTGSSDKVKRYFNTYFGYQLEFPSNDVDAVIGFLSNKGFDKVAAQSTGSVLLQQAKIDGIKVFELLDTLKGLDKLQLSYTVAQVLNFNRQKTSTLGFRVENTESPLEARNIMG